MVKDGKLLGWAKALFTRPVEFHGTRTNERDNRVVAHTAHTKNILAPGEDSVGPYIGAWGPCCSCDKASIPFVLPIIADDVNLHAGRCGEAARVYDDAIGCAVAVAIGAIFEFKGDGSAIVIEGRVLSVVLPAADGVIFIKGVGL